MKQDVSTMTVQQIERELKDFEWEYIALADKAQTDEYYAHGSKLLDIRKEALGKELRARLEKVQA